MSKKKKNNASTPDSDYLDVSSIPDEDMGGDSEKSQSISDVFSDSQIDSIAERIIDVDDVPQEANVLIFGQLGSGKTTFACTAPKPLLLDIKDRGTISVMGTGTKTISINKWEDIELIYWYLKDRKHPYQSIVLDTVTHMQDLAMRKVLGEEEGMISKMPHKGDWGNTVQLMKYWTGLYRDLPLNTIFIAQEKRLDEEELDEEEHTIVPLMSPSLRSTVGAMVDFVLHAHVKQVLVKNKKTQETKTKNKFLLRMGPNERYLCKGRRKKGKPLPETIEPHFDEVLKLIEEVD